MQEGILESCKLKHDVVDKVERFIGVSKDMEGQLLPEQDPTILIV